MEREGPVDFDYGWMDGLWMDGWIMDGRGLELLVRIVLRFSAWRVCCS